MCKPIYICNNKRPWSSASDLRSAHSAVWLGKLCQPVREMAGSHNSWSGINAGNESRGSQLQSRPGVVTWRLEVQSQELIFKPAFTLHKCMRHNEFVSKLLTSVLNVLFLGSVCVFPIAVPVWLVLLKREIWPFVVFCELVSCVAFQKFL